MRITNLFRHSNVGKTAEQPTCIKVLKETTSQLVEKLQQVKQKAESSQSMNILDSKKINDCYKKIKRDCDKIVINAEKFQNKHYVRYRTAIAVDGVKLDRHVDDFLSLTSQHKVQSRDIAYTKVLINDAIESSTSTRPGNGIHLNKALQMITEFKTPQH